MNIPEDPEEDPIIVEMYDIGINDQEFKEETHYLPSGEVFMYTLKWNHPERGELTIVGELVEGVWRYFYIKPHYKIMDKGVESFISETYSYESVLFLDPSELISLVASPVQVSTKVSTKRVAIGADNVETQVSIQIIKDKLKDSYELLIRDHSFILKQEDEVVAAQNLMQQMILSSNGPRAADFPIISRKGQAFEIITDDYLLVLVPSGPFYLGKLSGEVPYQTEG